MREKIVNMPTFLSRKIDLILVMHNFAVYLSLHYFSCRFQMILEEIMMKKMMSLMKLMKMRPILTVIMRKI